MERIGKERRRVEERIPKQENLHHKSAKRLFYFILSRSCTHYYTHTQTRALYSIHVLYIALNSYEMLVVAITIANYEKSHVYVY